MNLFATDKLEAAAAGDLETLITYDAHGLLLAPGESAQAFASRVRKLAANIAEVRQEVSRDGRLEFLDTRLRREDEIPPAVFESARRQTHELYRFAIDWVPGFFTDYKMGLLHAGCAFYSYDDFFALFILRKSFQKREKWLIYSRTELMAHELCHIAHVGFRSLNYEELFAYQTATSGFRKLVGGVLRTPKDTYLILGSVLCLLVAQVTNVLIRPPELWNSFPMPLIFGLVPLVIGVVVARYLTYRRRWRRAQNRLADCFGIQDTLAVTFRCSEAEIALLAAMRESEQLRQWLTERQAESLRWQVILARFAKDGF